MGRQVSAHKKRLAEEDLETVREDYVKKMRDNYPLIIRTLMHDLIVSVDKDGNFVFLNDAAVDFWGKPSEEIIGTHFSDYLYPEDVERTMATLQEMIKSKGQVKGFIVRVKSPRGARTVAWNAVAIVDESGNYIGAQATGKDLTDFLRTEEELKWSRSHFQRLFEVIVDPIIIVDMTGTILELSQSAEEILGYPREELVGKHFLETNAATAESKAIMETNLEKIKKGIYIEPHPIEAVTKDKRKLLYELTPARIMYRGQPAILSIFRNITEQKKAEEKLQASEERFNYFLDNAPEAIWVQDLIGTFLDGNKRAEELTGYKKEELIGKNMLEILVPPESVPRLMEAFKANKPGEISGPTELELIKKDGSLVSIEASTIPIERNGKIEIISITRDITERKKMERELEKSEEKYRKQFEEALDAIFLADAETGIIVDCNRAATKLVGRKKSEMIGNHQSILHPPEEIEGDFTGGFKKHRNEDPLQVLEERVITKNGEIKDVAVKATIFEVGNKRIMQGTFHDITERKKAEEALQESEKRFRELSELLPETVFETDATGKLTFMNQIAFDRFGYTLEDFDKCLFARQMIVPGDRDRAEENLGRILRGEQVGANEYTAMRKDGSTFPTIVHTSPIIRGNKPVGLRGVLVDITDRKKAEEALKKSEKRFRNTLDNMLEGCQIIDYNWRYLYVNNTAARHGRFAKEELLGKKIMEMYPGIEKTKLFSVLSKCMKERVPAHIESEFTFPSGESGWFEISVEPVPEGIFTLSLDISDRKEVEEALRQEREMLETVTENINAGLIVVSKDYIVLWANDVLRKDLGDVEGKHCYSAINNREDICHGCGVKEVFETGKDVVVREELVPAPDGKEVWLEVTASAIRDENGEIVAASEMSRDITERKKAEEALKESEKKYREIINAMNDTAWVIDFEGKIVDVNDAAVEVMGYSREELLSIGLTGIDSNLDPEEIKGLVDGMPAEEIQVFETVHTTKDGKKIPVEISSSLVTYRGKRAILSIARDITERNKAEEALRRSEEEAKRLLEFQNKIIDTATVWVNLIDLKGNVILWNRAAELVSGYSREEVIGHNKMWKWIYPDPNYRAKVFDIGKEIIESGKRLEDFESIIKCKDGSLKTISWYATNVLDEKGKPAGSVSVGIDVTERKKAQKAINKAMRLFKQSNEELES
ncbi:PAS domain S-box protein, partial [bacterium]